MVDVDLKLCGRVGCGEPAVSVLLIAPLEASAWLVTPKHPSALEGVPLCEGHADRISVPFGWNLTDERPPPRRRKRAATKRAKKTTARSAPAPEPTPEPSPTTADVADAPVAEPAPQPQAAIEPRDQPEVSAEPSPSEVPVDADRVAAEVAEDEPRLSVVPGDDDPDKTFDFSDEGQGALWNEPAPPETEPDDSTPLLKRAFRVVRDDQA